MTDDYDDNETWRKIRPEPRPLTDSEREVFRVKYESGVPSVRGTDHEDTSPIDLFERAPVDRDHRHAQDLVAKLRRHPEKLVPFLGEFAEWVVKRMREQSSSEQKAVEELRELLSKPPNGATARLQSESRGHATAISELAERAEESERRAEKAEARIAALEGTIKSAKGTMWKAAATVAVTIAGSAVAIITSWQASAERAGAAAERSANDRRRLDRLEQRDDELPRSPRRDYDYDIVPRPAPLKKEPGQ